MRSDVPSEPAPRAASTASAAAPLGPWITPGRPGARALFAEVASVPRTIAAHADLLKGGLAREVRARFRGSLLGVGWVLAQPLALFVVYAFLFTRVLGVRIGADAPAATLGVYMFLGTLAWAGVSEGITRGTNAVLENRHLVAKLRFPAELLPVQAALASLIPTACGFLAFWIAAVFTPLWSAPGPRVAWVPVLFAVQLALTAGPALALAAWNVRLRDTAQVVAVALTALMFATPVFWVASPAVMPGVESLMPFVDANPFHHLLVCWRSVWMGDAPAEVFAGTDFARSLVIAGTWGVGATVLGLAVFLRGRRELADEV